MPKMQSQKIVQSTVRFDYLETEIETMDCFAKIQGQKNY